MWSIPRLHTTYYLVGLRYIRKNLSHPLTINDWIISKQSGKQKSFPMISHSLKLCHTLSMQFLLGELWVEEEKGWWRLKNQVWWSSSQEGWYGCWKSIH